MAGLLVASPDIAVRALLNTAETPTVDAVSAEALETETRLHRYSLAVVDDRLPGLVVTDAVRRLALLGIGVLILTADTSELNAVLLRELGADDVVGHPYSAAELRARVHAILRRRSGLISPAGVSERAGPVCLSAVTRLVAVRGRQLHVAPLEYAVLFALQVRDGAPVSREVLVDECWPPDIVRRPDYVDAVVRRLRLRLEVTPSAPRHVITVRKLGYALRTWSDR